MLDFDRAVLNEVDKDEVPVQYFFAYKIEESELDAFLAYYVGEDEIPEDIEVSLQELCLSKYSDDDYKLEVIFNGSDGNQYWIEIYSQIVLNNDIRTLLNKV